MTQSRALISASLFVANIGPAKLAAAVFALSQVFNVMG